MTTTVLRCFNILSLSLVAGLGLAGCADASANVDKTDVAAAATTAAAATAAPSASNHGKGKKAQKRNARRGRMPAVFVDGEMVGVIKFQELPPQMPIHWVPRGNMNVDRRFLVSEFLEAVGVNLKDIKGVHIYGGKRISNISGDEFRKKAHNIQFRFTRDLSGRPAFKYVGRIEAQTMIEKITRVMVYIDKPVPAMKQGKPFIDGEIVELPYVDKKVLKDKGTRVYLDGRYMGVIKRRHVKNADSKVLADLLSNELEIDVDSIKRAHFVGSRDAIAKQLVGNDKIKDASLVVSAKKNGRVSIDSVDNGRAVDAIVLYDKASYVDRSIDPPEKYKVPGELPHIDDAVTAPKKVQ